jgi:hypothetical protein
MQSRELKISREWMFLGQNFHGHSMLLWWFYMAIASAFLSILYTEHYKFVPSAFDCVMKNWILIIFLFILQRPTDSFGCMPVCCERIEVHQSSLLRILIGDLPGTVQWILIHLILNQTWYIQLYPELINGVKLLRRIVGLF